MVGYDLFCLFIKKNRDGGEWHTVFIHTGMKTRKLRMVRWRASQCLGNTSTFGESLADRMDKISIICTCNREVYSKDCSVTEWCLKKEKGKL